MASLHIKLPDGRSGDPQNVLPVLEDEASWDDPSTEMYVSHRDDRDHTMLTVIRRLPGVCLVFREPNGTQWVSTGEARRGVCRVELQDVTLNYPARFFVDLAAASRAVQTFLASQTRDGAIAWSRLGTDDLVLE